MPSKTEEYLALAQRTANGLTRYWESWTDYLTTASSADFLVYRAVFRSNAPVTRIFSPRSFRVLRRAGVCTKGSGIYTVHRQHKRLPGSFSPQYRRCTVQCVPGPCRFARHAPSDGRSGRCARRIHHRRECFSGVPL